MQQYLYIKISDIKNKRLNFSKTPLNLDIQYASPSKTYLNKAEGIWYTNSNELYCGTIEEGHDDQYIKLSDLNQHIFGNIVNELTIPEHMFTHDLDIAGGHSGDKILMVDDTNVVDYYNKYGKYRIQRKEFSKVRRDFAGIEFDLTSVDREEFLGKYGYRFFDECNRTGVYWGGPDIRVTEIQVYNIFAICKVPSNNVLVYDNKIAGARSKEINDELKIDGYVLHSKGNRFDISLDYVNKNDQVILKKCDNIDGVRVTYKNNTYKLVKKLINVREIRHKVDVYIIPVKSASEPITTKSPLKW